AGEELLVSYGRSYWRFQATNRPADQPPRARPASRITAKRIQRAADPPVALAAVTRATAASSRTSVSVTDSPVGPSPKADDLVSSIRAAAENDPAYQALLA